MSITLFQVVKGGKSLEQATGRMERGSLTRTAERPGGETVDPKAAAGAHRTDDYGNLLAVVAEEYLDEHTAPGGEHLSVVKARTIDVVFTPDAGHLLVFAGKQGAGPIAAKVSDIAYNAKDSPVLSCRTLTVKIGSFIEAHKAQTRSCSWMELQMPALSGASLNGREIGACPDFQRFDKRGLKNSVRVRLPALGMAQGINRGASLRFYTSHELREQVSFVRRHVAPLCG